MSSSIEIPSPKASIGRYLNQGSASHSLLGGDTTDDIYKFHQRTLAVKRRNSESELSTHSESLLNDGDNVPIFASDLRVPGMFRRNFITHRLNKSTGIKGNFIDFLSLYGKYAGDEDKDQESDDDDDEFLDAQESLPLVPPSTNHVETTSGKKAFFLLIKSFVGTGVLFLPRAFQNGGLAFSIILLIVLGFFNLHCMLLLVDTSREMDNASFGDIGEKIGGKWMKGIVLSSIAVAQCGFCCAYFIFVAQNLRDITMVATECKLVLPDYVFIGIQLLIYIPLSLVRKIKHFSSTSIVADIFILLGLGYIVYLNIIHLFINGPATDIQMFNLKSFPLFIGTALFAFEGICLVLPIEQSMKHPEKFKPVLTLCVITIGFIFIIVGMLGYIAFGSKVETNVFLNLPNDSPVVSIIQFLYAISIILTFPLTVYPAIRIIETGIFGPSSGKSSTLIKWQKNGIRSTTIIILALVAIFGTDNLDSFVSLVGCFACIPLVFIYPAYFHSFIAKSRLVYFKDFGIVVVGFIAMAYNCWVTVKQMVDGSKDLPRNRCFPNFEGGAIL